MLLAPYGLRKANAGFFSKPPPRGQRRSPRPRSRTPRTAMFALAAGKRDTDRRLGNLVLQTELRVTVIGGALAAAVLAGVVLDAAAGRRWADPLSALVILVYGLHEARHAWGKAG